MTPVSSRARRNPRRGRVRILGVDPGSECTGYGVIDSDGSTSILVEYSTVRLPTKLDFADRLLLISQKLDEVITRLRPAVCAVEESFYAVNARSALKLGQVRGAVLLTAARAGLRVHEYTPLAIKSALVGYGRAEKRQVQEMVRLLLAMERAPEPLDASDALAVAICHAHRAGARTLAAVTQ